MMLLQLSWFFPLCPPPPSSPEYLRQSTPCPIVHVHGSYVGSLATPFAVLYFTSPWLFCNYLFVLNSLTSSPVLPLPLTSGNLPVTNYFSLASKSLFIFNLWHFIMMCFGVGLFASIVFGTLCFLDLHVYFIHQIREVFIILSNRFPIFSPFSSLSGTCMMWMLNCLMLPLEHPLLGTWPETKACALTGNRTSDPLVRRLALNQSTELHQPGLDSLF